MLNLHTYEDISVIELHGELGPSEVERVTQTLFSLMRKHRNKMVLNFEDVEHVHYLSIQTLVETLVKLKGLQGDLKFAGMSDYTKTIFRFVGVQDFVENFDTVSEAVLAFRPNWRTWH